jgi:predicted outer membrane repeat protein
MRWIAPLFCVATLAATGDGSLAATYVVTPDGTGDYATIQEAIDAAEDGDVIELADGTFTGDGNRDLSYLGKAITVRSQSGNPGLCTIDCEGSEEDPHRGFAFDGEVTYQSVLEAVTVKNGFTATAKGGAIYCAGTDEATDCTPWIKNCIFTGNFANVGGGIASLMGASPRISNCTFVGNTAHAGGAIACPYLSGARIQDCAFLDNSTDRSEGGGAIDLGDLSGALILNSLFIGNQSIGGGGAIATHSTCGGATIDGCTFVENTATGQNTGGAIYTLGEIAIDECTFYGNAGDPAGGIFALEGGCNLRRTIIAFSSGGSAIHDQYEASQLTGCDLYGNAGGDWVGLIADQFGPPCNLSEDPLFCDPENHDFGLAANSPCKLHFWDNITCYQMGAWDVSCDASPRVCCVEETCLLLEDYTECTDAGGEWLANETSCDPNPCVIPTVSTSWGTIKALYRR